MARKVTSFRVGKVTAYLRNRVWYLVYHENGQRRRPRVGPNKEAARQLAAQTNAQLAIGAPAPLSFEPLTLEQLRARWLHYHEHVRRSSVATVCRYRTATLHLLNFARDVTGVGSVAHFRPVHAEEFAAYLRRIQVAPNGHRRAAKRPLRDKGVKYILEVCRSLFNYAAKRRHLPPYAENPFTTIEIDRIPVEDSKPFIGFSEEQERRFLEACDEWQFPIFATLLMTGLRPGELVHLLLPDDLDLAGGWLKVRNKTELGWSVKTRNERTIPLVAGLADVLRRAIGERVIGPVFLRRGLVVRCLPTLTTLSYARLEQELRNRTEQRALESGGAISREAAQHIAGRFWYAMGIVKPDTVRVEFMHLTGAIGLSTETAPKTLRHMFATALQDANVDPLIRNQLMGHVPAGTGNPGGGLSMTGIYTHSRPETIRRQLEQALRLRPLAHVVDRWLARSADASSTADC